MLRNSPLITASSLERALECPASVVLPKVQEANEFARRGNDKHGFVRAIIKGVPVEKAILDVAEENVETCQNIDFQKIIGDLAEVQSEMSWAYDVETGKARFLGENIGRNYPQLGENEIAGTEDVYGIRLDGNQVTRDVKTGFMPVTLAKDNPQVKFFALVHNRRHPDHDTVEGGIAKIGLDGKVKLDSHDFTQFELDSYADDLEDLVVRIKETRAQYEATGRVEVSKGEWCSNCNAKVSCPAYTALAKAMGSQLPSTTADQARALVSAMAPEEMGIAFAKAKAYHLVAESVIDAVKEMAKINDIPLENGKVLRPTSYPKEQFSGPKALKLLEQLGASPEQITSCYSTIEVVQVRERNTEASKSKSKTKRKLKVLPESQGQKEEDKETF